MIAVENLTIAQGNFTLADVSLTIPDGQYAVLMGRTGCGKTTLLEAIAGLRPVTAGRILVNGKDVTRLPPAARCLGYVPQDAAVFRTMTVRDNLAFALAVRRLPSSDRVAELAGWLGLTPLLDRPAVGLSGGEAQRVALGRALAANPPVLLLDEPLSGLDDATRESLVTLLESLRDRRTTTVLHVTHHAAEADRLADVRLGLG